MRVQRASEALERGSCLELYYPDHSMVIEPHAVGFDKSDHPALLGWEVLARGMTPRGQWQFLRLDEMSKVEISGYFSEAPRPDYQQNDPRFDRIIRQL